MLKILLLTFVISATACSCSSPEALNSAPASLEDQYMKASVKVRVWDADGSGNGELSATMIGYNQANEMIVLTAAHGFRGYLPSSLVEVLMDYPNFGKKYQAKVLQIAVGPNQNNDDKFDVAVVSFKPDSQDLVGIPVKKRGHKMQVGNPVISIGFDYKKSEPVVKTTIIKMQPFVTPAEEYLVGFPPYEGRSGGGLFDSEGFIVGTCTGRPDNNGLFMGLETLYKVLDDANIDPTKLRTSGSGGQSSPSSDPTDSLRVFVSPLNQGGNVFLAANLLTVNEIKYCTVKDKKNKTCLDPLKTMTEIKRTADRKFFQADYNIPLQKGTLIQFRIGYANNDQKNVYKSFD